MINNHTRACCRVLCVLDRGGRIIEIPGREGESLYETGEKRNKAGQTKAEWRKAHNFGRGNDGSGPKFEPGEPTEFVGAKISFGQDLRDRLEAAGHITAGGKITKAGREHIAEVHKRACQVMDCVGHEDIHATAASFVRGDGVRVAAMVAEETNHDELADVLTETGFLRPGLSTTACCAAAATMMSIIDRLGPSSGEEN